MAINMRARSLLLVLGLFALGAIGCEGHKTGYRHVETRENLGSLVDLIVKTSEAGDAKKAGAMVRALIPDEPALKKAFKDNVSPAKLAAILDQIKQVPSDDAALILRRSRPTQTEIQVHGATPEEIATGSTVASGHFSGGAKGIANDLRPDLRFYEVAFVEPGADSGMRYHLFFWDGARWRMLGPVWLWLEGI